MILKTLGATRIRFLITPLLLALHCRLKTGFHPGEDWCTQQTLYQGSKTVFPFSFPDLLGLRSSSSKYIVPQHLNNHLLACFFSTLWSKSEYLVPEKICKYMYPDISHSAKLHASWQKPFNQTTCTLTEAIQPNYMYPDRRHPAKIHVFWPVKWASMDTVEGSMYIWVTTEMARQASLAFKPIVWRQT